MFVIGLTGGIGTGKSQVSRLLEGLGAAVVNADLLGHEVYKPGSDGLKEVVGTFGEDILTSEGEVDRRKLGAIVFGDPEQMKKLNAITHPRIYRMAESRIRELVEQGSEVIVLEAALLIEANWTSLVDEVWVTISPEDEVVKRLQERNGLSKEAILSRINSQMAQAERAEYGNLLIENSGSLEDLAEHVTELWNSRVLARKENVRKR
jgi:dephospho-CoA kinase